MCQGPGFCSVLGLFARCCYSECGWGIVYESVAGEWGILNIRLGALAKTLLKENVASMRAVGHRHE